MATSGDLVTTIISDLGRNDTSLSDIVLLDVQSAVAEYESYRFHFNEQIMSITLSSTDTYALSLFAAVGSGVSDIIEVDEMILQVSPTRTYPLDERPYGVVAMLQANGITGYPRDFCIYNQAAIIYPKPNQVYTLAMSAHVKLTPITDFSANNAWTNDASNLIRNAALKRLWGRRFRDMEAAQAVAMAEQNALQALQHRATALSGSTLTPYI